MAPTITLGITTTKDPEGYLYDMGSMVNSIKRRTTPVVFVAKLMDDTIVSVEISDSAAMKKDAVKFSDHPLCADALTKQDSAVIYTKDCPEELKEWYATANKTDAFSVQHLTSEEAPGYFKPCCKGVTLYYMRFTKYLIKGGYMEDLIEVLNKSIIPAHKELGFPTFQMFPVDEDNIYMVEIGTPQLWMQHLKKSKQDPEYKAAVEAMEECFGYTETFYYGNVSDMMLTVTSAKVRASMFGMPQSKGAGGHKMSVLSSGTSIFGGVGSRTSGMGGGATSSALLLEDGDVMGWY